MILSSEPAPATSQVMGDDGSDSDEWGAADLPDIPILHKSSPSKNEFTQVVEEDDEEEGWSSKLPTDPIPNTTQAIATGDPVILVDMTMFTQNDTSWPEVHSRIDRYSVNDTETAKRLRKRIEADYDTYAKSTKYLSEGVVIPCGSSVWKEALSQLRDQRPGHYFCPIFPPKKT